MSERTERQAVADLITRCAHAQDDRDWDVVRATFAPDAVYVHPGGALEGVEQILQRTRAALEPLDASQHLLGSQLVEVNGGKARSRCYFQAQHVRHAAPGGELYTIAGTYDDTLALGPDGWRITRRVQTYAWRAGNRAVVAR